LTTCFPPLSAPATFFSLPPVTACFPTYLPTCLPTYYTNFFPYLKSLLREVAMAVDEQVDDVDEIPSSSMKYHHVENFFSFFSFLRLCVRFVYDISGNSSIGIMFLLW
jgi:hypothetical protein